MLRSLVGSEMCIRDRLIFASRRHNHMTPLLRSLHWLRVPERATLRLAILAYRCLHGSAPAYLASEPFPVSRASRRQRLRLRSDLAIPCINHATKSCICGFSHVGLQQHIAWHPYVTISDHFQMAPQDQDAPAVIRITFTVSVTTVNCTETLTFYPFADKNSIVSSYFIVKKRVFCGIYKKKGLGLLWA